MPLILVVDDEVNILQLLKYNLTKEGYQVISATNGSDAIKLTGEKAPDLIVLDKMLPEMDGFDVLRILKANRQSAPIPVIMLSARNEELDKVLGLELGADDYITKPFSPRELVARVKVHLRHGLMLPAEEGPAEVKEIRVNGLVIQPEKYEALLDGVRLELTQKEFELLHLLAANPGRVFTRDILLEKIWGYDFDRKSRTVDVHISYLRQKIEKDPANPEYIETVRGVGYRFREFH
ncbi:response regulator transcription factor [Pelotomaculum terephthalicicum JT]|uniref:response regulator transcription factor n=1 Tax=Pelotomaculum TaxID=191373 RepID=UPI0009CC2277|nr:MULTISPECIES: response regulator transcription factor [Pelotomaculum]MCG9969738.1 response regulator transcription factor [Pelotomaculum terephthalicicum JT]OPX91331.1 MAG: Alkaline phosphatase synthesis transcriptional regulatory protein PhoP [Pelotomaculum sp. PtaB.Bin117]OPY61522.1 MAG: Alkaline phosphatase synthesis transcriptional regulatory protein PhoP [Pelotomaculum sp. PtaU1.Bin065]